jgi:hypothetical protein
MTTSQGETSPSLNFSQWFLTSIHAVLKYTAHSLNELTAYIHALGSKRSSSFDGFSKLALFLLMKSTTKSTWRHIRLQVVEAVAGIRAICL